MATIKTVKANLCDKREETDEQEDLAALGGSYRGPVLRAGLCFSAIDRRDGQ